jgi:hypothetical protein
MVSTLGHHQPTVDETTARPAWPEHTRPEHTRTDGVVDLRDERDLPYDRGDRTEAPRRRGLRARRTIGWILGAAIVAAVVVVVVLNRTGEVGIDVGFDEGTLPFWSVIAGSAVFGFVAGRLLDDGC